MFTKKESANLQAPPLASAPMARPANLDAAVVGLEFDRQHFYFWRPA